MLKISSPTSNSQTITIRPSLQPKSNVKNQQQIIVIPQSMLVNGCISTKDLKNIIDTDSKTIKTMENRSSLKRPLPQASSDYGSDSETSSEHSENKPARKRANLDHLSPEEKLMRRKLKNRVAAQNARDKKRAKMEDMEIELQRIKVNILKIFKMSICYTKILNFSLMPRPWKQNMQNWHAKTNVWWKRTTSFDARRSMSDWVTERPMVHLSYNGPLSQQNSLMYLSSRNRTVVRQVVQWTRRRPH